MYNMRIAAWITHLKMFAQSTFDRSFDTCIAVLHMKANVTISIISTKFDQIGISKNTHFDAF